MGFWCRILVRPVYQISWYIVDFYTWKLEFYLVSYVCLLTDLLSSCNISTRSQISLHPEVGSDWKLLCRLPGLFRNFALSLFECLLTYILSSYYFSLLTWISCVPDGRSYSNLLSTLYGLFYTYTMLFFLLVCMFAYWLLIDLSFSL